MEIFNIYSTDLYLILIFAFETNLNYYSTSLKMSYVAQGHGKDFWYLLLLAKN